MKLILPIALLASILTLNPGLSQAEEVSTQSVHLDSTPDIDGWGFEIGFGTQPYMESVTRATLLSPFLFESSRQSHWRLSLDLMTMSLQAFNSKDIGEFALSLEANSKIYKDIVYSFAKFGLGMMSLDDDLYDGNIFTIPLSLGFQIVTMNTKRSVLSFFVEHRFNIFRDYDEDKSLPSQPNLELDESALFSGTSYIGIRMTF